MSLHSPLRAVIDTNVLLDFWVFDDPASRSLRAAIEDRRITALRSGALIDEFVDVLMRPGFDLSTDRRFEILRHWDGVAEAVEPSATASSTLVGSLAAALTCSDASDQKFLNLAFSAQADWLVTKDKALLKLARRAAQRGLAILQPADTARHLAA